MDKGKVGHRQKAFNGAGTSWEAGMNIHTYYIFQAEKKREMITNGYWHRVRHA